MDTLFGILTVEQWLALLRIGIGLWWLKSFIHKALVPICLQVDGRLDTGLGRQSSITGIRLFS